MMRAVAHFIMSGRWRAAMVALLGSWLPVVTPATVGLVTLRLGAKEGLFVLGWAILPALVGYWGGVGPLMAWATLAVMVVVFAAALYLRVNMVWAHTLMVLVASATLAVLAMALFMPDFPDSLVDTLGEFMAEPEEQTAVANAAPVYQGKAVAAGTLTYLVAMSSLLGLLVARWWQALLYNPGGFQTEIHNLRLPPFASLTSAGATAYCLASGGEYLAWVSVFSLPLVVAGIGLVHCLIKRYRLGYVGVLVFYLVLVLVRPALLTVAALAFADTWLNLRNRFKSAQ